MPKSVPPEPWKLSRRGAPATTAADLVDVVEGAGAMTAVADAAAPLGTGRVGRELSARAVGTGGALARAAPDGGGAGARRIFSSAAT
jgi:hypothetical protein